MIHLKLIHTQRIQAPLQQDMDALAEKFYRARVWMRERGLYVDRDSDVARTDKRTGHQSAESGPDMAATRGDVQAA